MKEIIIPLAGIIALFVIPAMIGLTAILLWFKSRNRLYNSIDDAIEKGASPEVIQQLVALTEKKEEKEPKSSKKKYLADGFIMLGLGGAFSFLLYYTNNKGLAYPAAILSMLGIAHLLISIFIKQDKPGQGE